MLMKCLEAVDLRIRNIRLDFRTDPDIDQGSIFQFALFRH